METKEKQTKTKAEKLDSGQKISKTWEAFLRNKGTGKIIDMRAVLK